MAETELGAYLRARREQVAPSRIHLPVAGGYRRVPGLRREEVALLAGVSMDYYTRLEQGRERRPSAQVVDALAAALHLDEDARLHLFRLAGLSPRAHVAADGRVDPSLLELVDAWPNNPAIVYNRAYDVLAANAIADALFSGWPHSRNLLRAVFTDPAARTFYRDWPAVARNVVAGFRLGHGAAPHDPRVGQVLTELLDASPEFTELWSRHDARGKSLERKRFIHSDVGPLELTMQTFDVRSSPGQELVVYHAEPSTPSAEALALLGSLAATRRTSG
ncbi:helix-turn-helix transcriptional regulator [Nocardia lijiangensis]|uniref:helix-turn-helix transcriptional regulator n=1 Tax=Nocardia lijiangensis TaxID=299618 RepID=UPI00082E1DAF|nr:helix-turn-helix transcriptional regulator [Nocardia lijiangensis]